MKRFLAFALPTAVIALALVTWAQVNYTNIVPNLVVQTNVTIGGVTRGTWPSGGFSGAVSNSVASSGLLAVDASKTNGIAATAAHVVSALGYTPAESNTVFALEGTLTHSGNLTTDLSGLLTINGISLTGALTVVSANLSPNHRYTLFIQNAQASNCVLSFPAWRFANGRPTNIMAGRIGVLQLRCRTAADTNVIASYAETE